MTSRLDGLIAGATRLYQRTLGNARKVVILVRKKGLRDIVTRRVLVPMGVVRTGDGSTPFTPHRATVAPNEGRLRIALLADSTLEMCLAFDAEIMTLRGEVGAAALRAFAPAFCLVTTEGLAGAPVETAEIRLHDALAQCRELGIATVLWIEDESLGLERVFRVARDFDHIFATRSDTAQRVERELPVQSIGVLPCAVQPALHNPSERAAQQRAVCWLRSGAESPAETDAFRQLLKRAECHGLDVFDIQPPGSPARVREESSGAGRVWRGSLDYQRVLTAYRAYRAFLVSDLGHASEMRTALEIAACGARVLSPDGAPELRFPGHAPASVSTAAEGSGVLDQILADGPEQAVAAHRSYREIVREHTYAQRLEVIGERVGAQNEVHAPPLVSVLAATNRPEYLDNILANFDRQTHPRCELVLLLNSSEYELQRVREQVGARASVQVFQLDEALTLGECLNYGIDHSTGSWVAKFDDDDLYGAEYLADLLMCTRFANAPVLGKRAYHVRFEDSDRTAIRFFDQRHRYVEFVHGGTLLIRREVFDDIRFEPVPRGVDTTFQRACRVRGLSIYSSDPYNFVHVRHGKGSTHTWTISDRELLEKSRQIRAGLPLEEIMV